LDQIGGHDKASPLGRIRYDQLELQKLEISADLFRNMENSYLKSLYDDAIKGNVKHSKILKVLGEEPFFDFQFNILKTKLEDAIISSVKRSTFISISSSSY